MSSYCWVTDCSLEKNAGQELSQEKFRGGYGSVEDSESRVLRDHVPVHMHSLRRNREQIRPRKKHQHQGAARHGGHGNIWGHSEKKLPKLEVRAFVRSAGKGRKLATSLRL